VVTAVSLGATLATCADPLVLVPGSVGALRDDAAELDQQSRALAQQAGELRDAHPATWTGTAADGWAARREQFAQTLETVSQIHATAASTLLLHASTLRWGQAQADVAVRMYARGCALRDAELGRAGVMLAGRGTAATDAGAGHRNLAESVLASARDQVSASARAAAAVLDDLSAGLPDGRWHLGDFARGMWSWVTGIADVLLKFNAIRGLADPDGMLRDGADTLGAGIDAYGAFTDDPIGTSEQLAQLDLLRDRPAEWWGQLTPDIALAAVGGVGAATRALRGVSMADMVELTRAHPSGLAVGTGARRGLDLQIADPRIHPSNATIVEPGYEPFPGMSAREFMDRFHTSPQPDGSTGWNWPDNGGAVPGSVVRRPLSGSDQLVLDRIGGPDGGYFSTPETSFGSRAVPPDRLNFPRSGFTINTDSPLVRSGRIDIEFSEVAPAFGQPGGGPQVRFFQADGTVYTQEQLVSDGVISTPAQMGGAIND
jgi:hypothetical protein